MYRSGGCDSTVLTAAEEDKCKSDVNANTSFISTVNMSAILSHNYGVQLCTSRTGQIRPFIPRCYGKVQKLESFSKKVQRVAFCQDQTAYRFFFPSSFLCSEQCSAPSFTSLSQPFWWPMASVIVHPFRERQLYWPLDSSSFFAVRTLR